MALNKNNYHNLKVNYCMYSKFIKKKELNKDYLESSKSSQDCKVSIASNEIMLDRFYNGKVIEFPFSQ